MLNLQDTLRDAPNPLLGMGFPMDDRRAAAFSGATQAEEAGQSDRMAQALDMLDHGLVLLSADGRVLHQNKAARRELAHDHPLQVVDGRLQTRQGSDAAALRDAIAAAAQRGLRRLLALGQGDGCTSVAVVPLAPQDGDGPHGVALLLARRQVCQPLTLEWFARSQGLTMAETAVVKGLCADLTPQQIADQQGVGLATVRTQIGSVRMKTGAGSIRALLRQVALLPPVASVLPALTGASAMGRPLNA
jgi:DNA-binding CsgD family transcriptional regulator